MRKRCNISSHRTWLSNFRGWVLTFSSILGGLSPFPSGKCTFIIGIPETEHVKILLTLAGKGDNQIPRCIGFYLVPCHQPLKGPSSKCMSRCILSNGSTRSHLILLELVVFFPPRIFSQVEFMNIFETNKLYNSTGGCNDCLREWVCWLLVDVLQIVETWNYTVAWVMWTDCAFSRGKLQYVDSLRKSLSNLLTNQEFMVPAMFVAGYHNLPRRLQKGRTDASFRVYVGMRHRDVFRIWKSGFQMDFALMLRNYHSNGKLDLKWRCISY